MYLVLSVLGSVVCVCVCVCVFVCVCMFRMLIQRKWKLENRVYVLKKGREDESET